MSLITTYKKIEKFLSSEIWHLRIKEMPKYKAILIRSCRVMILSFRGFHEDRCSLRASALTFYSLLSIVPVVAMFFGIAKGFGFQQKLETQLLEKFVEHEVVVSQAIEFSKSMLDSTKGGVVAGVGVLLLFWTLIRVLGNIELSFNDIWKVRIGRNVLRKFTDYLTIMLIAPINFLVASSATVLIASQMEGLSESLGLSEVTAPILSLMLRLIPWAIMWILFSLVYIVMPNTKVKWASGFVAAVIAGTAFQLTQIIFIEFQLGVASYNAIYGGFAALPLFLVWLQLSWLIILLGAEISYAIQNVDSYEYAPRLNDLSNARRKLLTVYIAYSGVKAFTNDSGGMTVSAIATKLGVPTIIVQDAIEDLLRANLFSQIINEDEQEAAYQPATDISRFTISFVIEKLDHSGSDELPATSTGELKALSDSLTEFEQTIRTSSVNKLLSEL